MPISAAKKQLIYLELERAHFNASNAVAVFNRATIMYFILLVFAIFGIANRYITKPMLNALITLGMLILLTGAIPYFKNISQETKTINKLIKTVKSKK